MSSRKNLHQNEIHFENEQSKVQTIKYDGEEINLVEDTDSDGGSSFIEIEIEDDSSSCKTISDTEEEENINVAKNLKTNETFVDSGFSINQKQCGFQRVPDSNAINDVQPKIEKVMEIDGSILNLDEYNATFELNQVSVENTKMEDCDIVKTSTISSDIDYVNISSESECSNTDVMRPSEQYVEKISFDKEETETNLDSNKEALKDQERLIRSDGSIEENFGYRNENNNKNIILNLIEEFRRIPQLWHNQESFRFDSQQNAEFLVKITDNLNEKLNTKFDVNRIKLLLCFICKQYEQEVERQLIGYEEKTAENSCLWFYRELHFLQSQAVENFYNKLQSTKNMTNLNYGHLGDVIDIYKTYDSLWDITKLQDMENQQQRFSLLQSMCDEVKKKLDISLNAFQLRQQLFHINKQFSDDKRMRIKNEIDGDVFKPSFVYYYKCKFLGNHQPPFKCLYCTTDIFETYEDYQEHNTLEHYKETKPKICGICGLLCRNYRAYVYHKFEHSNKSNTCELCGKIFKNPIRVVSHRERAHGRKTADGKRVFTCQICAEQCDSKKNFNIHKSRHQGRHFNCNICGRGFLSETEVGYHYRFSHAYNAKCTSNEDSKGK